MLTNSRGFDAINLFDAGRPLRAEFPATAAFHMNPTFRTNLLLPDNVCNSLQVNLVSQRVRDLARARGRQELSRDRRLQLVPDAAVGKHAREASSGPSGGPSRVLLSRLPLRGLCARGQAWLLRGRALGSSLLAGQVCEQVRRREQTDELPRA